MKIEESQHFLNSTLDELPLGLFVKDSFDEYRFVRWNKTMCDIFGLTEKQVLGKNDYDLFPKEQADFFAKIDQQVVETRQVMDVAEEFVDSPRLGRICLHTVKTCVSDLSGQSRYLVGICENITSRKAQEQDLMERTTQLQKLNDFMMGRELRIIELKEEIKNLEKELQNLRQSQS